MFSNTPPPRTSLFFPPVSGAWDCQRPGITNKDQGKGSTWVPWLPCFPFPCHRLPFLTQQQVQRCYFCCWYTYSSPSCCSLCISPDSSVGFPDTITTYLDSLCIPPCHLSVVPSLVLHFHVWVLSEVPSSSIQASCYLCMISHWSGWPNPELAGDYSWKLTNSPGSLFLPGSSSLWFIQAGTWRGQSVLLKPRVVILLFALFFPQDLEFLLMVTATKAALALLTSLHCLKDQVEQVSSLAPWSLVSGTAFIHAEISWIACTLSKDTRVDKVDPLRIRACTHKASSSYLKNAFTTSWSGCL